MKKSIALFCLAALAAGAFGTSAAEPAAASAPAAAPAAAPVETARQTPREGERSGRRMRGGAGFLERLREQYPNLSLIHI